MVVLVVLSRPIARSMVVCSEAAPVFLQVKARHDAATAAAAAPPPPSCLLFAIVVVILAVG